MSLTHSTNICFIFLTCSILSTEAFCWSPLRSKISLRAATTVTSPEKVPEKTPGAWFTKLSMMAPGLRERVEGPVPLLLALLVL